MVCSFKFIWKQQWHKMTTSTQWCWWKNQFTTRSTKRSRLSTTSLLLYYICYYMNHFSIMPVEQTIIALVVIVLLRYKTIAWFRWRIARVWSIIAFLVFLRRCWYRFFCRQWQELYWMVGIYIIIIIFTIIIRCSDHHCRHWS